MSSSPSTRFDGNDICGKAADELPIRCEAVLRARPDASDNTRRAQAAGEVSPGVRRDEGDGGGTSQSLAAIALALTCGAQMACRNANNGDSLLTVAIAPHQVYGPRDMLFLHNMLGAGNKLRIFGTVRGGSLRRA